jgi:hypothetical protein
MVEKGKKAEDKRQKAETNEPDGVPIRVLRDRGRVAHAGALTSVRAEMAVVRSAFSALCLLP